MPARQRRPPDPYEDAQWSDLTDESEPSQIRGNKATPSRQKAGRTPKPQPAAASQDWYDSAAFKTISRKGSRELPENSGLATPNWIIGYFRHQHGSKSNFIARARLLGQILYWFGVSKSGKPRTRYKDKMGRTCIFKTKKQLGYEVWIDRKRVGRYLKEFAKEELINCERTVMRGRPTCRITILPAGILKAYLRGADVARAQALKACQ
ncbi:MAG: hypothetical protein GXY83_22980 [Rhodopirellula sp.]|nr:hypothetical protein [Rhodopirellula sp.]